MRSSGAASLQHEQHKAVEDARGDAVDENRPGDDEQLCAETEDKTLAFVLDGRRDDGVREAGDGDDRAGAGVLCELVVQVQTGQQSNTEISNTDLLNTYPINSTEPEENGEPVKPQQPERIGMDKILAYRQLIKQNIEYDILCQKLNGNIGILNEIVDIITETVCTTREYLTVASEERNAETVKSKLLKLNSEHIEYVIDCMKNNTTDVHDTRKYLLAALFNAPSTIDSYYTLKVNHDMYGGN